MSTDHSRPMLRIAILMIAAVVVLAAGAAGGYWAGHRSATQTEITKASATAAPAQRKLLYYRNPMGLPDTSPTPKKDPMGMDYIAVYEGEDSAEGGAAGGAAGGAMGTQINISTEKVQKLGVRTEAAALRSLERRIRAAGRIEPDERRITTVAPKFEGYVERLHVSTTGQAVSKGQALFEVYSPELVSAQREYAIAAQGVQSVKNIEGEAGADTLRGMTQLADASLSRLRNWDVSPEQIKALSQSGEVRRTLTLRSPVSGVVTEKKAVQGMRFMPGETLYQITDLSSVWVVADVFEQDIALAAVGGKARVSINAYPGKVFEGRIAYVYPTLNADTRTVPVRVELSNPGGLLKPGMFAQVDLPTPGRTAAVTVPLSAVIDSGTRQIVLVQIKAGRYEPRQVKLGDRNDTFVEVREGVREGEQVVVTANFLIDAESNLKAAVSGFSQPEASKPIGHQARGKVEEVDARAGTVTLQHGPVASLKWPAMTMEFQVANGALLAGLKPGATVNVEFVERGKGEWVITQVEAAP